MKRRTTLGFVFALGLSLVIGAYSQDRRSSAPVPEFNDGRLRLTNYIREGTDIREFIKLMGAKVGRPALFGIPLE